MAEEIKRNAFPGVYHIADNPELYEPQRTNNFELQVMGLENLIPAGSTELDNTESVYKNGQEVLRLSIDSSSIPAFEQSPIEINYGNNIIKYAGKPRFTTQSLRVKDYIGADSKGIVLAWQRLSYDVMTQKVGKAADYKKTAYLVEYTPNYEVVRTWELRGCWISNVGFDDFNMENSNVKNVTPTIAYDYAYLVND